MGVKDECGCVRCEDVVSVCVGMGGWYGGVVERVDGVVFVFCCVYGVDM